MSLQDLGVRLAWPLLGHLAGSPELDLQADLHFLPEQDFLVARNLAPFAKGRQSVPRERRPTCILLQEAAGMLECGAKWSGLHSIRSWVHLKFNSFTMSKIFINLVCASHCYQALGIQWLAKPLNKLLRFLPAGVWS